MYSSACWTGKLERSCAVQDGTQKSQKVFMNIPTEVGATEAEAIGGHDSRLLAFRAPSSGVEWWLACAISASPNEGSQCCHFSAFRLCSHDCRTCMPVQLHGRQKGNLCLPGNACSGFVSGNLVIKSCKQRMPLFLHLRVHPMRYTRYRHGDQLIHYCGVVVPSQHAHAGVEHLLRDVKDATVSTLAADVSTLATGLNGLQSRLLQIQEYLSLVLSGKLPVNHDIMYQLQVRPHCIGVQISALD